MIKFRIFIAEVMLRLSEVLGAAAVLCIEYGQLQVTKAREQANKRS